MASTQANTWPPLVSGGSQDELLSTQLYGKEVVASALFEAAPDDEFFFPVDGILSGFGFDGILYENGAQVPGAEKATWFTETPGPYRGNRPGFPQRGLVLLTDAGLTILDLESRYAMWMVALRADSFSYTHNFLENISGFYPTAVSYQNGRVVVSLSPDPGSTYTAPIFLIYDFTTDSIYMERAAYRPPIVGPYSTNPARYRLDSPITPNVPVVDLVNGGKPTFWWSYPMLPAGLLLDTETGVITGTPTVSSPDTAYQVVAYNPGGQGATIVNIATYVPVDGISSFTAQVRQPTAWVDTLMGAALGPEDIFVVEESTPAPVINSFSLEVTRQPDVPWDPGTPQLQWTLHYDLNTTAKVWVGGFITEPGGTPQGFGTAGDLPVSGHVVGSANLGIWLTNPLIAQDLQLSIYADNNSGFYPSETQVYHYTLPPLP